MATTEEVERLMKRCTLAERWKPPKMTKRHNAGIHRAAEGRPVE